MLEPEPLKEQLPTLIQKEQGLQKLKVLCEELKRMQADLSQEAAGLVEEALGKE